MLYTNGSRGITPWTIGCLNARRGARCTQKPRIPTNAGTRTSDLIACTAAGVFVRDTTIVANSCVTSIEVAYRQKVVYYDYMDTRAWIGSLWKVWDYKILHHRVDLDGALHAETERLLEELGLSKADRKLLVVKTLEGSIRTGKAFATQTGRSQGTAVRRTPPTSKRGKKIK